MRAASSPLRPAPTYSLRVEPITSSASVSSDADRRAAAAGLFSSWASPAAIVPSAASRSRFCSTAVMRRMIGPIWRMIRRCTGSCARASRRNSSAGIIAKRASVRATMRPSKAVSVIVGTAPIQVGAVWRSTGSSRLPSHMNACTVPSNRRSPRASRSTRARRRRAGHGASQRRRPTPPARRRPARGTGRSGVGRRV